MADLRSLLEDVAAGRLSRRRFVGLAARLGVSAPLAAALARHPAAVLAQGTPEGGTSGAGAARGPAAERLLFSSFNVDQAPLEIQNDAMDLYLFGLKTPAAKQLEAGAPGVRLINAPASTISLLLNPAPDQTGGLNPFSIREVRVAMQFLVDRNFIANDIYQGRAVPMYSYVSPLDYDELTVFDTIRAANLAYDAEFAKQTITAAMTGAGATLENNVWSFGGRPIQIKIVTRVEDERRDVGDLVRAALEGVGFQTQPVYQPFGPATLAVYSSDPITFQWHIYTEGWGRSSVSRYQDTLPSSYAAPWLGNMPGWQEVGYWQYEQEELDDIAKRLFQGKFTSQQERDDLFRQATQLALNESVRVWLVTALQAFPARADLQEVTEDLAGGPKSLFTLREAYVEGKDEVRVGHLWVSTERTTWNPVGGFGDVYSADIVRNMSDPAIVNHPFTGLPIPFRAEFDVETGGPDGTVPLPEDAVIWDPAGGAWKPVGGGVTAISKVTFDYAKYFQAPYHHGVQIEPADLIYSLAQSYEQAYDEQKIQIETVLGVTQRPYLETFKGFRLLEDDRFEVYVDYWHFEPGTIASYAGIGGLSTPWELLAAMDDLVYNQRLAAYTDTAAARFSVPWLNLVTRSDAALVVRTLRSFADQGFVPAGVFEIGGRTLATPDGAKARYRACLDWFEKTNLLVISNGPFFLNVYDPPAQFAELLAFRAEGYPFKPGDWRLGAPERLAIQPPAPVQTALGQPIDVPVTVTGPGALMVRYVLVDPAAGAVATSGEATPGAGGSFTVTIDAATVATLFPSVYQLYLLASSDAISQVAEQRVDLSIGL
ncbi:MAG: ABC transporter substrate-binding protein [Chloroflexota bacterium]|nr:ABC transporter substrate-binding protein [Chloroflexota bacterium]